ncbi:hypothetical protein RvY_05364-1 [Ramazzottius varieornatus]|uniref:Uncharacterized protein n=1 Tax=Ramazzottius varieornatus TaxID=947166 RepID=A0A1D1V1G5_RAMVA|nr:hypothetical protein RvY_05364-1 [Ramazzottius varieornatus]
MCRIDRSNLIFSDGCNSRKQSYIPFRTSLFRSLELSSRGTCLVLRSTERILKDTPGSRLSYCFRAHRVGLHDGSATGEEYQRGNEPASSDWSYVHRQERPLSNSKRERRF